MDYGEVVEKIGKGKISKGTDDDVKEEEKGRAVVLLLGWESKEAHMVCVFFLRGHVKDRRSWRGI